MRKIKKTPAVFFVLVTAFLLLDFVLFFLLKFSRKEQSITLKLSAPTEYYNFKPVSFGYEVNGGYKDNEGEITLKLLHCGEKTCEKLWEKKLIVSDRKKIAEGDVFFANKTTEVKKLVLAAYDKKGSLLSRAETEVITKNLLDELYLFLDFDRDVVADGDLLTINYIFINRSKQAFLEKDYSLSLNFGGPLEKALNSGRIIKDISQDILPGQTVSSKADWAVKDYNNRQAGLFDVSLYLAYKDKDGKQIPVTSFVRQVRWP